MQMGTEELEALKLFLLEKDEFGLKPHGVTANSDDERFGTYSEDFTCEAREAVAQQAFEARSAQPV